MGRWQAGLVFLWHADGMRFADAAIWCAAIVADPWATGRYLQGALSMLEVLTIVCAALATVSALGMLDGYFLFKPLTIGIAIGFVAKRGYFTRTTGRFNAILIAALVFSLAGGVFRMLPGNYFIRGLASFLVAYDGPRSTLNAWTR